jgi:hypothetical protein
MKFIEGSAGRRPLCTRCAHLRAERIRRNRALASLHIDDNSDSDPRPVESDSRALMPSPITASPVTERRTMWSDASVIHVL